ncbi:LutC/YkgG family protein [Alicyclobacillus vulcanalis]|uniref:L-lactate dehydrogenase complex protein LldG n=1 Tax=Alicyclobacillus vulcanalis TaxID=252246 RepID=A0A1N7N275_9BACL|nr:lactate utilization protein [Alicyclobacillus vulcanalis]SIS92513.1 L-lactate dehydrogenase complex protein LldG [Alicyclobacillus vulcanalis]
MDRAAFLANIAARLGRNPGAPPAHRDAVGAPDFWAHRTSSREEIVETFCARFQALAGEIVRCEDEIAVRRALDETLGHLHARSIGAWGREAPWPADVEPVLAKWQVRRFGEAPVTDIDVGITGARFGVADTGTLVLTTGGAAGRTVHQVPLVHIVIMREEQIVQSLGDVMARLRHDAQVHRLPAYVHFISGPSRSSDIENDQTIGVHGPARVICFLIRAAGPDAMKQPGRS